MFGKRWRAALHSARTQPPPADRAAAALRGRRSRRDARQNARAARLSEHPGRASARTTACPICTRNLPVAATLAPAQPPSAAPLRACVRAHKVKMPMSHCSSHSGSSKGHSTPGGNRSHRARSPGPSARLSAARHAPHTHGRATWSGGPRPPRTPAPRRRDKRHCEQGARGLQEPASGTLRAQRVGSANARISLPDCCGRGGAPAYHRRRPRRRRLDRAPAEPHQHPCRVGAHMPRQAAGPPAPPSQPLLYPSDCVATQDRPSLQ